MISRIVRGCINCLFVTRVHARKSQHAVSVLGLAVDSIDYSPHTLLLASRYDNKMQTSIWSLLLNLNQQSLEDCYQVPLLFTTGVVINLKMKYLDQSISEQQNIVEYSTQSQNDDLTHCRIES